MKQPRLGAVLLLAAIAVSPLAAEALSGLLLLLRLLLFLPHTLAFGHVLTPLRRVRRLRLAPIIGRIILESEHFAAAEFDFDSTAAAAAGVS